MAGNPKKPEIALEGPKSTPTFIGSQTSTTPYSTTKNRIRNHEGCRNIIHNDTSHTICPLDRRLLFPCMQNLQVLKEIQLKTGPNSRPSIDGPSQPSDCDVHS